MDSYPGGVDWNKPELPDDDESLFPICPHCGAEQDYPTRAWDSGDPEFLPGSLCNDCDQFVLDDGWI